MSFTANLCPVQWGPSGKQLVELRQPDNSYMGSTPKVDSMHTEEDSLVLHFKKTNEVRRVPTASAGDDGIKSIRAITEVPSNFDEVMRSQNGDPFQFGCSRMGSVAVTVSKAVHVPNTELPSDCLRQSSLILES